MAEIIRMPRMSDTMEEGNIIGWLKQEGDRVESGQTIAEVETDKATMELDSYTDGVLLHIAVKSGPVPIDGIIAVIGQPGEDWQAAIATAQGGNGSAAAAAEPTVATAPTPVAEPAIAAAADSNDDQRVKASPLARSIAREAGINLTHIQGSGDAGRIVKRDVEAALQQPGSLMPAPASTPAPVPATPTPTVTVSTPAPAVPGANYEEVALSQMRKVIARRLSESKFTAPHFYLTVEINMDKAMETRQRLNEISPVKLSFNDLVIKAAAAALRHHPAINSSWLGDRIRYNKDVNIGVAVAIEEGLLVPVIRNTDQKTLSQINTEVKQLAGKAKERKLQPEEMQGNTFTISNLGMFGIEEFTAIINPPDSCIMAVGGIIEKPVVREGQIVVGNVMKVTLSCDHRVVDGATGAQFLQTFRSILEDPIRMLV